LGRGYIARLIKEGYDSAKALAEATPEALAELVPADIAKRIARKFNHATEPKRNQKLAKEVQMAVAPITRQKKITDAILVLDRQHPGTIEFQGKGVKLTSKQFWLLTALAESPGKCVPYDALYNKVWGKEVAVELQQLSYHKSQLLKKINRVAPKSSVKTLITPVSGEGMVLNLRPDEITIGRA
jgi:DNA-binding response OmpR family regulator